MEVIYNGLHQTPEQIVETAIQEDADAIGLSILSGAHMSAARFPATTSPSSSGSASPRCSHRGCRCQDIIDALRTSVGERTPA